jgi:1,4-dihydroxy-2-naphthoate polyprenyltransferase
MSQADSSSHRTTKLPLLGRTGRQVSAYIRLGKLNIWQIYVTVVIAWTLLPRAVAFSPHAILTTLLFLVCVVGVVSAGLALDDVVGYRIGMDKVTYGSTEEMLRSSNMKPLLSGELTADQGVRYGMVAGAVGTLAGVGAILLSWHASSPWALVVFFIVVFLTLQYSYGLGFSFRFFAGSELVLLIGFITAVALPYALVTATLTGQVILEALLVAVWMLQVGIFSNSADAPHDRHYGRTSIAASVGEQTNRRVIIAVFITGWALVGIGIAARWLTPWLVLLLVPAVTLHVLQLRAGVGRQNWLVARKLGFRAYELGCLALILTNVAAWLR